MYTWDEELVMRQDQDYFRNGESLLFWGVIRIPGSSVVARSSFCVSQEQNLNKQVNEYTIKCFLNSWLKGSCILEECCRDNLGVRHVPLSCVILSLISRPMCKPRWGSACIALARWGQGQISNDFEHSSHTRYLDQIYSKEYFLTSNFKIVYWSFQYSAGNSNTFHITSPKANSLH